jgi:quercetin dioxygenase-like cupin family protein
MSVEGVILPYGTAEGVTIHGSRIDYLTTANQSQSCSVLELSVAPGFDTGAHYHTKMEEFFYVLEGQLNLRSGDRTMCGGPGTFMFVPRNTPHSYGNPGPATARVLLITSPSGFEKYFDELAQLAARGGPPDPAKIAELRARYDTIQIAQAKPAD